MSDSAWLMAKGSRLPLMAEGVEEVGADTFCATIVRVSHAYRNIDSIKSSILKHCFKNVKRPDFFNSLGQERKSRPLGHEPDGITHSDFARIALARASIPSASSARAVCRSSAA